MTDEERLQNTIDCIQIYCDTMKGYCDGAIEKKNTINDPNKLAEKLELYMDGIRYNYTKIMSCYDKLCDATGHWPEWK